MSVPAKENVRPSTALRILSAKATAASGVAPGRISMNSSPP
jgi:hypothetical protein